MVSVQVSRPKSKRNRSSRKPTRKDLKHALLEWAGISFSALKSISKTLQQIDRRMIDDLELSASVLDNIETGLEEALIWFPDLFGRLGNYKPANIPNPFAAVKAK
jgi:hypothetical protein